MTQTHPEHAEHGSYSHLKLGRLPSRPDPRTFLLARYVDFTALPPIPDSFSDVGRVHAWPMYGNDSIGDCTCAAAAHMVQAWTSSAGKGRAPTLAAVEKMYWETGDPPAATGQPEGSTDTGRYELDVLNYWRHNGLGKDRILAYAKLDPLNIEHVKAAIYLFGGVYTGVRLPMTAQTQRVWDVVGDGRSGQSEPGSWGGHAVPYHAYDKNGVTLITWGAPLRATWRFHSAYTDEAYAIITHDWLNVAGRTPAGFDLATLESDLGNL